MSTSPELVAGGQPHDALAARYIHVVGTNREIGRQLAEAADGVHGALARPSAATDPIVERARRRWLQANHPALHERAQGVADHFGLDPTSEGVVFDRLMTTPGVPFGCSVACYPGAGTTSGHTLLARNFDLPPITFSEALGVPPASDERTMIADPWIVEMHPTDGYASVSLGVLDLMGAMDGINEAGLVVALLADDAVPREPLFGASAVGLAEPQVVRFLLDTCGDVDEAKQALLGAKHYYAFISCHFVVADRHGRSFIWEHSPHRNMERIVEPPPDALGRTICTNHLVHLWPDVDALPDDGGPLGTASLTFERFRLLHDATRAAATVDGAAIDEHFAPVTFGSASDEAVTVWHGLYDLDARSVDVTFYLGGVNGEDRRSEPRTYSLDV